MKLLERAAAHLKEAGQAVDGVECGAALEVAIGGALHALLALGAIQLYRARRSAKLEGSLDQALSHIRTALGLPDTFTVINPARPEQGPMDHELLDQVASQTNILNGLTALIGGLVRKEVMGHSVGLAIIAELEQHAEPLEAALVANTRYALPPVTEPVRDPMGGDPPPA